MTLKNLLKENESTIKEYELFFNDSFQKKNIELNLYKKTNHPKNPEIAEIHITSKRFPLDLHLKETINAFLKSGVLHPRDNPNHNLLFDQLFRSKTIEKLLERFIVLVFISKFFQENLEIDWEKFKSRLVKSINKKYSLIFVKSPKNNDDFINSIIFSIGYLIHMLFFQIFPLDRPLFTIRFILDVYHIIIFQLHGLFISDYYLQNQFEKVFTSKFMDYEIAKIGLVSFKEEGEEEHKKSTIRTPSFILSKGNPKINENNFQEFAGELSNKLKVKPKLLKKRDSERSMTTIAHARIASKSESKPKIAEDKENEPFSERMKFNCFQVSPGISSIINAPYMPGRKTTSINYSLDKSYINCTRTFLQLFNRFQNKLHNEAKKTSRSLPKISSFHQNAANIISEKEKIDNLEKANKLQKHMKDLSLRLKKQEQRFSTLNSSKIILENVKKRKKLSITEKIIKELEVESKKRKEIEKNKTEQEMLKPIKLKNRIENKKSIVYLKDNTQSSSSLILIKNSLEPSNHLKREIAKSNFKPLTEIEIQKAVNDRLNAKVYEKGESIDVNEGMHRKVKTFFMLQSDEENVFDGKEKKKEYINKYAKLITENINENIKRINLKLAVLNKEKKSYSLHN